jgi:hypothetical protein
MNEVKGEGGAAPEQSRLAILHVATPELLG